MLVQLFSRSPVRSRVVAQYRRDGYTVLRNVVDAASLPSLRAAYDEILQSVAGTSADKLMGGAIHLVPNPSKLHDAFRDTRVIARGREMASALMGVGQTQMCFDMLIFKEPGNKAETAWHQDHAYADNGTVPAGATPDPLSTVQMWIALDDVDEENGCMHFLPGYQHKPMLAHQTAPAGRMLEIENKAEIDLSRAVSCPLRAGDATAHGPNTPHFTTGNRSRNRPRRAYIVTFAPA